MQPQKFPINLIRVMLFSLFIATPAFAEDENTCSIVDFKNHIYHSFPNEDSDKLATAAALSGSLHLGRSVWKKAQQQQSARSQYLAVTLSQLEDSKVKNRSTIRLPSYYMLDELTSLLDITDTERHAFLKKHAMPFSADDFIVLVKAVGIDNPKLSSMLSLIENINQPIDNSKYTFLVDYLTIHGNEKLLNAYFVAGGKVHSSPWDLNALEHYLFEWSWNQTYDPRIIKILVEAGYVLRADLTSELVKIGGFQEQYIREVESLKVLIDENAIPITNKIRFEEIKPSDDKNLWRLYQKIKRMEYKHC